MFFQPFITFLFSVIGNEMEQMGIGPALIDNTLTHGSVVNLRLLSLTFANWTS